MSANDLQVPASTDVESLHERVARTCDTDTDGGRVLDVSVDRRDRRGPASRDWPIRSDHLRRSAPHDRRNRSEGGAVDVREGPRRRDRRRRQAALHDRHATHLRRPDQGEGEAARGGAVVDGRRGHVRAGASTSCRSAKRSPTSCSPTTRCSFSPSTKTPCPTRSSASSPRKAAANSRSTTSLAWSAAGTGSPNGARSSRTPATSSRCAARSRSRRRSSSRSGSPTRFPT